MAGVAFRMWAQALTKSKGTGFSAILSGCRSASGMSKAGTPGPYPKTPEEVAAAAKKYCMRPEDYKPYPDHGDCYGDYPALPDRSQHERDPYYKWDHPDLRRNWGEPMHWDFDMYIRNRVDTSPTALSWHVMVKQLMIFIGGLLVLCYLGYKYPYYVPVAPKKYPYNNLYLEKGGDPEKAPEEVKNFEI